MIGDDRVLASPWVAEAVVVDDGSTDGTGRGARRSSTDPRLRVLVHERNAGKGARAAHRVRRGRVPSTSSCRTPTWSTTRRSTARCWSRSRPGWPTWCSARGSCRARPHRVLYYWHSLGNRTLTLLSNMFTDLNLTDMETCYKAFRREVLDTITIEENRFGIEPELTAKVARAGGGGSTRSASSYAGRTYAEGKKIGWRDGMRALLCIVRYSPVGRRLRVVGVRPTRATTSRATDA